MKRFATGLILALLALASAAASETNSGFTFGAELRYATTLDDMSAQREAKWDINLENYPVTAEVGWQWDNPFTNAPFETAAIVGIRSGYTGIADTEAPDHRDHYRLSSIPFGAYSRLEAGFLYVDLGIGAHRWSLDYEVNGTNLDNTGFGLATSVSAGVRAVLFRHLTFRTAGIISYYGIDDIGTGVSANSLTAGLVCGINFQL